MFETRRDDIPRRENSYIGFDSLEMSFKDKTHNVKNKTFLINGKKVSDKEQSYVKSYVNIMFTKISANKGIKVFVQ